ncbi:DegT/DnrJ/EryC1/StrS aminotransferase family protein [Halomonas organivorans]
MCHSNFPPWPSYTDEEILAVQRVLSSNRVNYWTGNEGRSFEREFAEFTGCNHAIAVCNGTAALELSLKGIGLEPGQEVIVPARSFVATASSVVAAGGIPVFADVDEDSQGLTAGTVRALITPRTKAVIAVHLAGWPCEMDALLELSRDHGLFLIEDCAQAHGAKYRGRHVGTLGHIGCWSFCQDKILTTGGEGGMVTTNDAELWSRMWAYKDHGKAWAKTRVLASGPGFRWLHDSFGTNWRMTEMQAAIGRIQLRRLDTWTDSRRSNARQILAAANGCPALRVPLSPPHIEHAAYKCYVFVEGNLLSPGWNRDRIMTEIASLGVPCSSGSCSEVYLEAAFRHTGWGPRRRLPVARKLGATSLMFLCHPTLTQADVDHTCLVIRNVMHRAAGRGTTG